MHLFIQKMVNHTSLVIYFVFSVIPWFQWLLSITLQLLRFDNVNRSKGKVDMAQKLTITVLSRPGVLCCENLVKENLKTGF